MKTDVEKKMQAVVNGGYRPEDMVRHIAQGQKRVNDYEPILADINSEMKHLTLDTLTLLYEHVKFLRKKQQVLPPEAPACPRIDEQPAPVDIGHARRTAPHKRWIDGGGNNG